MTSSSDATIGSAAAKSTQVPRTTNRVPPVFKKRDGPRKCETISIFERDSSGSGIRRNGSVRSITWHQRLKRQAAMEPLIGAFSGVVAGTLWASARAPFARVKLLLQVSPEIDPSIPRQSFPRSWLTCCRRIVDKDGYVGFWRGNWCMIAQQLAFRVADRCASHYFQFVRHVGRDGLLQRMGKLLAGSAAGAVMKTGIFFPLDVIRTRRQIRLGKEDRRNLKNDVFGGKRRLYCGFWSSMLSCFAYKVTYDMCFSVTGATHKNFWIRHFIRSYVSTAVAKTVAYPFLTISRRQMVAIHGKYRNDWHAFRKIVKEEGMWTLWRGFGLNFLGTFLATLLTISLKIDGGAATPESPTESPNN